MTRKRVATGAGVIFVISLLTLSCSLPQSAVPLTLSVGRVALPVVALTQIAEAQGYFSDEGVDVTFKDFITGREALTSACEGKQDLAVAFTTPVAHDIVMGKDLVVLTALHQSSHNTALVALANHGIEQPSDLAGKTVGVTMGTSGEFFLDVLLIDNGIDVGSVVRQPLSIVEADSALKEGRVDAVVAWNPYLHQIRRAYSEDEVRVFYSEVYVEMSMVVGLREMVANKEEAVVRFLRALARAQRLFANDPARAKQVESVQAKGPARIEADSPLWNDFQVGLGLNHVMVLTLEQDAEWIRSQELDKGPVPSFRRHIADAYLREVLPDAVTLPPRTVPPTNDLRRVQSDRRSP